MSDTSLTCMWQMTKPESDKATEYPTTSRSPVHFPPGRFRHLLVPVSLSIVNTSSPLNPLLGDECADGSGKTVDGVHESGEAPAVILCTVLLRAEPPLLELQQLLVALAPPLLASRQRLRQHRRAPHYARAQAPLSPPLPRGHLFSFVTLFAPPRLRRAR